MPQTFDFRKAINEEAHSEAKKQFPKHKHIKVENIDKFLSAIEYGYPEYEDISPLEAKSLAVLSQSFKNDTDADCQVVVKKSITTAARFTWSITEGFSTGLKVLFQTHRVHFEFPFELDFSSTQTHTKTTTQNWEVDITITVPKRSTVTASLNIPTATYNEDFTVPVRFWKNFQFHVTSDGKHLFDMKSSTVFENAFKQLPNYMYKEDADDEGEYGHSSCTAKGHFKGVQGIRVDVVAHQHPQ